MKVNKLCGIAAATMVGVFATFGVTPALAEVTAPSASSVLRGVIEASPTPVLVPAVNGYASGEADDDQVLPASGGRFAATIFYHDLTVGSGYRVEAWLVDQATDLDTGLRVLARFNPGFSDGAIQVGFDVPAGFAGKSLVVFESIFYAELDHSGLVASPEGVNDAAQRVKVESVPA